MTSRIRASSARLKIYGLLVEGNSQSRVSELLELTRAAISKQASELEADGFISRIKGSNHPVLYEKGPRGPELDSILLTDCQPSYARGVTSTSSKLTKLETAKVHHLKYKAAVLKVGDTQFLKQYFNRRNVQRFKGQIPYYEHFVSVEYEETPNLKTFYVFPPEMNLTAQDLGEYENEAAKVCQDILNAIAKKCGWQFGIPEKTNWETHIAVESPALVGQIAGKYYMESQDGTAFLSNSEGTPELEYRSKAQDDGKAIQQASIMLELAGNVIELKTSISAINDDLQEIARCLAASRNALYQVAEIQGVIVKKEAAEIQAKVKKAEEAAQASFVTNYDGMMYQ